MDDQNVRDGVDKRGRGRPLVGSTPILVRVPPDLMRQIDAWRRTRMSAPCRPAAMREMAEMFLAGVESNTTKGE
jgi:hypothetical protein